MLSNFQIYNHPPHLRPRRGVPLDGAVEDVAELLAVGRGLRAEAVVHAEDVVLAVPDLLDARHAADL